MGLKNRIPTRNIGSKYAKTQNLKKCCSVQFCMLIGILKCALIVFM